MGYKLEQALINLRDRLDGAEKDAFEKLVRHTSELMDENDRLHCRLEDNCVWRTISGKWIKQAVEPGSIPDGIECRDETIRLLQDRIKELES